MCCLKLPVPEEEDETISAVVKHTVAVHFEFAALLVCLILNICKHTQEAEHCS